MAVFRVEKNSGYTVMPNHHLRNRALSLKAKGLLSQMLSLPEDWDYTLQGLARINRESRTTTNTTPRTRTGKILFCTTKARKCGNKTRQSGKWC